MRLTSAACALACGVVFAGVPAAALAQEPASWKDPLTFHTFSIAAVDRATGEVGVAVATHAACVGNGVPWVRVGVGAVATQADTRTDYGPHILDRIQEGATPASALAAELARDPGRDRRQIGVIGAGGLSAQHTGASTPAWSGDMRGADFVVQGNTLASPEVIKAMAANFEASGRSPRHLADRLIDAVAAADAAGGDIRRGQMQSAAVIVADPRPGHARREDKVSTFINVCEHADPIRELRRVYDSVSETLGYRTLQQFEGRDVWQLEIILQALGFLPGAEPGAATSAEPHRFTPRLVAAIDQFRRAERLEGAEAPPGFVDRDLIERLWAALGRAGKAQAVRTRLLETTTVTR